MIDLILYNLLMNKKKAKLFFKHNSFDILEEGDYVLCAISGKKIYLQELNYWNVDLQEAYFSPEEVKKRKEILDKK
jgi:hypothetical protein|tara:strand:- start:696 stop:923 length:228 start_codon:yes stop_codon:yes gene_type:complete